MRATQPPAAFFVVASLGLVCACQDLRLIDSLDSSGGGTAGTASPANSGGSTNVTMTQTGGASTKGGASAASGGAMTSAAATGGAAAGGTSASRSATGGVATGGVSTSGGAPTGGSAPTGGAPTGGAPTGGAASGGSAATGGAATGGAATGGSMATGGSPSGGSAATGGAATGGAATGGAVTGGAATGGAATGGIAATGGAATGGPACPSPITKPANLIAAEPKPLDPCARVSNVILYNTGNYAYGFTNGEVHVFDSTLRSSRRVDVWSQSGVSNSLPRALVTAQFAPNGNSDGSLEVGYADPDNVGLTPWYAGRAGNYWMAGSANPTGTVLGFSACPFHTYPDHLELTVPWAIEESKVNSYTFSSANSGTLNLHFQLLAEGYITSIASITSTNGWRVIAGTETGEIYLSNLLSGAVTWSDTTQTLSRPITWARITDSNMPKSWVTRIAVHPTLSDRVLVTFASRDTNALWYTDDSGQTWSNRHSNLPTVSNPAIAPPLIGASFNPLLDGAAYVVTPQTSYYTLDYGVTKWVEW